MESYKDIVLSMCVKYVGSILKATLENGSSVQWSEG